VGYADARAQAMAKFAAIHRLVDTLAPARVGLARTAGDARRIHASGRTVVFIGVENGYPVGADLAALGRFHALGARTMSLVHNGHSQLADSHTGERDGVWLHGGLSPLGRRAIAEMNRLGIIVDVSHASRASAMQSIALSRAPVVATHSAMRALCDRSRNLDDEQLRAIARAGGVAQVVAVAGHLRCGRARAAASVRDLVDHVDHAVRIAGIDHVGISSDFDGGGGVDGWRGADETINVTRELVRRGYTEPEIERLWGGNLLRVLDRVQQVARELRDAPPGRAPPRRAPPGRAVSRGAGW
jgi:membrane dipeptidase